MSIPHQSSAAKQNEGEGRGAHLTHIIQSHGGREVSHCYMFLEMFKIYQSGIPSPQQKHNITEDNPI